MRIHKIGYAKDWITYGKKYYFVPKKDIFASLNGRMIPLEYRKFYQEWKLTPKTPVHYIPKSGRWERNPETGEVRRVQNVPLKILDLPEMHEGLWGGEHVIQGFRRRKPGIPYAPHFWIPKFLDGVVYSEILDKHLGVVVTPRTIKLIHEHFGFDNYILKTPANDLVSELAVKIKRKLLKCLYEKTLYPDDENKREEVYDKYKHYLEGYTEKDIEWYGLTFKEANMRAKLLIQKKKDESIKPLKHEYRKEFIEHLKTIDIDDYFKDTATLPWWRRTFFPFY